MRTTVIVVFALLMAGCNAGNHAERTFAPIQPIAVMHGNEAAYPAPVNLRISRLLFTWIRWTRPSGVPPFTNAYIYRNTSNNFATARLLTTTSLPSYFDGDAKSGVRYWYWVRYGNGTRFGPTASASWPSQTTGPTVGPGTSPPAPTRPANRVHQAAPASLQAAQAPILSSEDWMQVGAMPAPDMDDLRRVAQHGDFTVYGGRVKDGVSAATLRRYLTDDARDARRLTVARFRDPPTVRIRQGATREHVRETAHAVQLINEWLPQDWKLALDLRPAVHEGTRPDNGDIIVGFASRSAWTVRGRANALGIAKKWILGSRITSAEVWVDPGQTAGNKRIGILIHELLHALGRGHVGRTTYPKTLMGTTPDAVNGYILHPLDRDALTAVHGVLGQTTYTRNLPTELGSWADTSSHLVAELPDDEDVRFGVSTRNGFAQAWASGPRPLYPLADNPALAGSASWDGRLIGYTPTAESVAGAMSMNINLTTMNGRLGFTGMEKWAAGQDVGTLGSGSRWNSGRLNYTVRVSGNHFLRTGGDQGELTGAFFGEQHESAAGTLERSDLTAAFGASR